MTRHNIVLAALLGLLVIGLVMYVAVGRKGSPEQPAATNDNAATTVTYLPLGDSYTIGESVAVNDRWPNQLAVAYKPAGKALRIVANPAVTGYTTQDLIDKELPLVEQLKPDFVTVLIGVNDYVQGVEAELFQQRLSYIVGYLQQRMAQPDNIMLITIPDYAKTPAGTRFGDPVESTAAITQFNRIITDTATKAGLPVADIFELSQRVSDDPQLTASDGLHPSAKQYRTWTEVIQQRLEAAGIPRQ